MTNLGSGNFRVLPEGYTPQPSIPECPNGQDEVEFIAANTVQFYLDLTYLVDHILPEAKKKYKNPGDGFPPGFKFLWVDDSDPDVDKTGTMLSSPDYMEKCLQYISNLFDDPKLFPTTTGTTFVDEFVELHICKLFTLMFRIFAIIHASSLKYLKRTGLADKFFTTFKHFVFFGIRYNLLVETDEFIAIKAPMRRLQEEYIAEWKERDVNAQQKEPNNNNSGPPSL